MKVHSTLVLNLRVVQSTTVKFDKDYTIDEFNDTIKPEMLRAIGNDDVQGQKVTDSNQYVIKDIRIGTDEKMSLRRFLKISLAMLIQMMER